MSSEQLLPRPKCCPGLNSIWKHAKSGRLYTVLTVARHSERPNDWIVVYSPLWHEGDDWVRNLIQLSGPDDLQWPGFLDLVDPDNGVDRFEWVAGPKTWDDRPNNTSGLGPLARLYNEAQRLEEIGPVHEGLRGEMDVNPNYRRLLRVIAAAVPTMFDEPVEVEGPPETMGPPEPTFEQLLDMLDNVSAAADNMMTRFGGQMYRDDAQARAKLVADARTVCDGLLRS